MSRPVYVWCNERSESKKPRPIRIDQNRQGLTKVDNVLQELQRIVEICHGKNIAK